MTINLANMSLVELKDLHSSIATEIAAREQAEKQEAKKKILEIAHAYGLSINDVLAKSTTAKKPVAAKYRNPDDPSQTWSGRGRKPVWFAQKLLEGAAIESLEIA